MCGAKFWRVSLDIVLSSGPNWRGPFKACNLINLRGFRTSQVALVVKNQPAYAGDTRNTGSIPGSGRFPWRRKWQPTPVFLPREFHRGKGLAGYSLWRCKDSDLARHTTWGFLIFNSDFVFLPLWWSSPQNTNIRSQTWCRWKRSRSVVSDSLRPHGL